jgi:hypothetical protein
VSQTVEQREAGIGRGIIQNYLGSLLAAITFAAGAALIGYKRTAIVHTVFGTLVLVLAVFLMVSGLYLMYRSIKSWVEGKKPLVILEFDRAICSFAFHKISGGPTFSVEAESEDIGDRNKLHFGPAEILVDENPQPAPFSLLCWNGSSKDYFRNGFVGSDFLKAAHMIRAQMNQIEFSTVVTITCKDRFGQRVEPRKLVLTHHKYGDTPVKIEFPGP